MARKRSSNRSSFTLKDFEATLEDIFGHRLPNLPQGLKKFIVKFTPWLILIALIFSLPILLAAFGLGTLALPFSFIPGLRVGFGYTIGYLATFIIVALEALALPGLFKQKLASWRLLFYASLVAFISNLLRLKLADMLIGTTIAWYLLFQIRPLYKK